MAQEYSPIQAELDANLLNNVNGITTSNFITENKTFSLANVSNPTGLAWVRSTLIPIAPTNETIGLNGYDKISGIYAIDVMGQLDKGYTIVKALADKIIAAFPRGKQFVLSNNEQITVETTGMAPNITQGAWAMNKLYAVQVQVKWFGYMTA